MIFDKIIPRWIFVLTSICDKVSNTEHKVSMLHIGCNKKGNIDLIYTKQQLFVIYDDDFVLQVLGDILSEKSFFVSCDKNLFNFWGHKKTPLTHKIYIF